MPIIRIVELKLGIGPIPIIGLKESIDIDGFLTRDLAHICIDYNVYMDPRQEKRLRFTYAHEVGHLILHRDEIQQCDFRTAEEWIHFHEDFLEDDLNWFEQQAYEFAGRLLVPREALIQELKILGPKIQQYKLMADNDEENIIQAVSRLISQKFQVSYEVVSRRIKIEKAWPQ